MHNSDFVVVVKNFLFSKEIKSLLKCRSIKDGFDKQGETYGKIIREIL